MIRRPWRRHRALALMARHERWRVAMGCPGVQNRSILSDALLHQRSILADAPDRAITPRRGEVYCRCERCHAARALVGWEPLA